MSEMQWRDDVFRDSVRLFYAKPKHNGFQSYSVAKSLRKPFSAKESLGALWGSLNKSDGDEQVIANDNSEARSTMDRSWQNWHENQILQWKQDHENENFEQYLLDKFPENIKVDDQGDAIWIDKRIHDAKWREMFDRLGTGNPSDLQLQRESNDKVDEEDEKHIASSILDAEQTSLVTLAEAYLNHLHTSVILGEGAEHSGCPVATNKVHLVAKGLVFIMQSSAEIDVRQRAVAALGLLYAFGSNCIDNCTNSMEAIASLLCNDCNNLDSDTLVSHQDTWPLMEQGLKVLLAMATHKQGRELLAQSEHCLDELLRLLATSSQLQDHNAYYHDLAKLILLLTSYMPQTHLEPLVRLVAQWLLKLTPRAGAASAVTNLKLELVQILSELWCFGPGSLQPDAFGSPRVGIDAPNLSPRFSWQISLDQRRYSFCSAVAIAGGSSIPVDSAETSLIQATDADEATEAGDEQIETGRANDAADIKLSQPSDEASTEETPANEPEVAKEQDLSVEHDHEEANIRTGVPSARAVAMEVLNLYRTISSANFDSSPITTSGSIAFVDCLVVLGCFSYVDGDVIADDTWSAMFDAITHVVSTCETPNGAPRVSEPDLGHAKCAQASLLALNALLEMHLQGRVKIIVDPESSIIEERVVRVECLGQRMRCKPHPVSHLLNAVDKLSWWCHNYFSSSGNVHVQPRGMSLAKHSKSVCDMCGLLLSTLCSPSFLNDDVSFRYLVLPVALKIISRLTTYQQSFHPALGSHDDDLSVEIPAKTTHFALVHFACCLQRLLPLTAAAEIPGALHALCFFLDEVGNRLCMEQLHGLALALWRLVTGNRDEVKERIRKHQQSSLITCSAGASDLMKASLVHDEEAYTKCVRRILQRSHATHLRNTPQCPADCESGERRTDDTLQCEIRLLSVHALMLLSDSTMTRISAVSETVQVVKEVLVMTPPQESKDDTVASNRTTPTSGARESPTFDLSLLQMQAAVTRCCARTLRLLCYSPVSPPADKIENVFTHAVENDDRPGCWLAGRTEWLVKHEIVTLALRCLQREQRELQQQRKQPDRLHSRPRRELHSVSQRIIDEIVARIDVVVELVQIVSHIKTAVRSMQNDRLKRNDTTEMCQQLIHQGIMLLLIRVSLKGQINLPPAVYRFRDHTFKVPFFDLNSKQKSGDTASGREIRACLQSLLREQYRFNLSQPYLLLDPLRKAWQGCAQQFRKLGYRCNLLACYVIYCLAPLLAVFAQLHIHVKMSPNKVDQTKEFWADEEIDADLVGNDGSADSVSDVEGTSQGEGSADPFLSFLSMHQHALNTAVSARVDLLFDMPFLVQEPGRRRKRWHDALNSSNQRVWKMLSELKDGNARICGSSIDAGHPPLYASAILVMQAAIRQHCARCTAVQRRLERAASIVIQAEVRRRQAKVLKQLKRRQRVVATSVQTLARGWLARQILRRLSRRCRACVTLQAWFSWLSGMEIVRRIEPTMRAGYLKQWHPAVKVRASQNWIARWNHTRYVLLPHAVQVASVLQDLLAQIEGRFQSALHVVVHKAMDLQDMATFGSMDPYVSVQLEPRGSTKHTSPIVGGGTRPVWMENDETCRNKLIFPVDEEEVEECIQSSALKLVLKVRQRNTFFADDLVGGSLPISVPADVDMASSAPSWHDLDSGGSVQITVYFARTGEGDDEANRAMALLKAQIYENDKEEEKAVERKESESRAREDNSSPLMHECSDHLEGASDIRSWSPVSMLSQNDRLTPNNVPRASPQVSDIESALRKQIEAEVRAQVEAEIAQGRSEVPGGRSRDIRTPTPEIAGAQNEQVPGLTKQPSQGAADADGDAGVGHTNVDQADPADTVDDSSMWGALLGPLLLDLDDVMGSGPDALSFAQLVDVVEAGSSYKVEKKGTIHVLVHRGRNLYQTNFLTRMNPYVRVILLPMGMEQDETERGDEREGEGSKFEARTEAIEGGDVDPEWSDPLVHKNHLILEMTDLNATSIELQVWTENTIADDLIGAIELKFPLNTKNECSPHWYQLQRPGETGLAGEIEATIFQVETEVNRPVKVQALKTAEGLLRNWMMKTFDADADTLAEVAAVLDDLVNQLEMDERGSNDVKNGQSRTRSTPPFPRPDQRGRAQSSPLVTLQLAVNTFRSSETELGRRFSDGMPLNEKQAGELVRQAFHENKTKKLEVLGGFFSLEAVPEDAGAEDDSDSLNTSDSESETEDVSEEGMEAEITAQIEEEVRAQIEAEMQAKIEAEIRAQVESGASDEAVS